MHRPCGRHLRHLEAVQPDDLIRVLWLNGDVFCPTDESFSGEDVVCLALCHLQPLRQALWTPTSGWDRYLANPCAPTSPPPGSGRPIFARSVTPPAAPAGPYQGVSPLPAMPAFLKRPESPMMNHLRRLGTMNSSPEYQHLLNIVMTQEQAKQELLERLEETERQLQQLRLENQQLRGAGGMRRTGSTASKLTMGSVAENKEAPENASRARSGSMRMRRSNSSRPRFTDALVVPFSNKEGLQEKYAVDWQTCLHVGTLNGLQSGENLTISRFFKGKSKSNSAQRVIKAVRKAQVPFFRLLEQHIGDQRALDHPHLCRLHDAFEDEQHVFQVYEFLSGPSLLEKILSDVQFCERDAAAATKSILMAISYLHSLSIAHQNVHLENMRFATQPRKKESGSCYGDQLKLMDLGLSLNRKLIPGILNAASQPVTETNATLPLLAPLGILNSLGSMCLPPESQGVCSSYAQLATAAPCMLRRTDSMARSPSPTLQRGNSQELSSISSLGQDSSAQRAQDLLLLLQAGDVWSTGCILHILLSGQIPMVEEGDKGTEPKLPLLASSSSPAVEICAQLLHGMPRKRATAEMALEHSWFAQCESIQKAHRSQKKNMSLTTARAAEFWERLRQTSAMTCLRRLFHSVRNVRRIQGLMIPGPEEDNGDPETNARAAADAMCAEAFEWLLYTSGATAAGGIPLRKLNSMIQSVIQSEKSNIPRHELEMLKVDTLISSSQFAEMIWATCA
ncbi:Calcium-dependent protein kinase 2 (PfCDPK2) [Durusdinium trenchii]|uniref:Calcium-dependent protein kinase 2 (PfCDPK2) n=1 Tax=Durusdinium trenchii TaxID=1381693 RepID=A0ABP0IR79_9DINO